MRARLLSWPRWGASLARPDVAGQLSQNCAANPTLLRSIKNPLSGKKEFEYISTAFFWSFMIVLIAYIGVPTLLLHRQTHGTDSTWQHSGPLRERDKLSHSCAHLIRSPLVVVAPGLGTADIPAVPATHTGKFISFVSVIFSFLAISVFCAIITAKLSYGAMPGKQILTLQDIDIQKPGGLCIESEYPLVAEYVRKNAPPGLQIIEASAADCIQAVHNRKVQAFLDDELVIRWCALVSAEALSVC